MQVRKRRSVCQGEVELDRKGRVHSGKRRTHWRDTMGRSDEAYIEYGGDIPGTV
jgi:hypothetical protein